MRVKAIMTISCEIDGLIKERGCNYEMVSENRLDKENVEALKTDYVLRVIGAYYCYCLWT